MQHCLGNRLIILLAMGAATGTCACGSESDPNPVNGEGFMPGVGGESSATEPAASEPAATEARGCDASNTTVAPTDGLIASFDDSEMPSLMTELGAFPLDSAAAPTFSTEEGALRITLNTPATSTPQVPNVLLGFPSCVDASAFSGVQFAISGAFSGCTMQYASGDAAHQDVTSGAPVATGPVGAYQPQATIAAPQLGTTPTTLSMPFVGGPSGGNPATPVDRSMLIFVLWQFSIAPAVDGAPSNCIADVTIDDVRFF